MFSMISYVVRHPTLRVYALGMFVTSGAMAATVPYLSLAGIEELGMSDQTFALMMFCSAIARVVFGVSIGIVSDFVGSTRRIIIALSLLGVLGYGVVWGIPSISSLWLAAIILIPLANPNPVIYAGTRSATRDLPSGKAAAANSIVRTSMSAAWVGTPFIVAIALQATGASVLNAWGIAAIMSGLGAIVFAVMLPHGLQANPQPGGPAGFIKALRELGQGTVVMRILALSLLTSPVMLNLSLQPLIIKTSLGGTIGDAGLVAGGVALAEIPFMLMWAGLLQRLGTRNVLAISGFLYAVFMLLLGLASSVTVVYLLIPLSGLAASALLSVPVSYVQDIFPERPGLGTALFPITGFAAHGIASGFFAAGNHITDYQGTSIIAAGVSLIAVGIFIGAEKLADRPSHI